jgi:hypothetical protein
MSITAESLGEKVKQKRIDTVKALAYDLKDQQANLADRLLSLKDRTIGASPTALSDDCKAKDTEENSLAIIEDVLRTALSYGSDCHDCVNDLYAELSWLKGVILSTLP